MPTVAKIETSKGTIVCQLLEDKAPNTVANFIHLASSGYYDGLTFHRVIADFMVQGGCPNGDGRGGPGWCIADEFHPDAKHDVEGVLSMANAGPNTGGSQFFITLVPTPWLDGHHAVFGRVVDGEKVLRKIGKVKTDGADRPRKPVSMKSVRVFRDGEPVEGEQPAPAKV